MGSWQGILLTALGMLVTQVISNNPPNFVSLPQNVFVSEAEAVGYTVVTLKACDPDDRSLRFSINGEVAKEILQIDSPKDFTCTNGGLSPGKQANVTLRKQLDREQVDDYKIYFSLMDGVNVVQRRMSLIVLDVNDNPPSFVGLPYRKDVLENTTAGSSVFQVSATDPDTGIGALVSYRLKTKTDLFKLNEVTGVLSLEGSLDYKEQSFYQLEIMALDGGGLNTTTDLIIRVLDVQNQPPYFVGTPYSKEVYENISVGASVLKVSALDGDRGIPNEVNYTLLPAKSNMHTLFKMDARTGEMTVAKLINREDPVILAQYGVIDLTVQTQEITNPPQGPTTARAPVTVTILDVNDQTPTFSKTFYNATVTENTQVKIPVTFTPDGTEMTVQDFDQGDNGRFQLSVVRNGQAFPVFDVVPESVLNEATLLIRVKDTSALDYERVKMIEFQVVAREHQTAEKRSSSATVQVHLEDANDNWPEFSKDAYRFNVSENAPKNTYIDTITATDKDSGVFGQLTYALRGSGSDKFRVDDKTGQIYVNVAADKNHNLLDRETIDTYYLTYEAKDGGGLRTTIQLEIQLLDENDNAPKILRDLYDGYVKENENQLERRLIIEATDIDLPPNNMIEYFIINGDPEGNFTINTTSGEIGLSGPLDYEKMPASAKGRYTLTVMAKDMGTPVSLNSTVNVIIQVEDMNDNWPYFTEKLYSATIQENTKAGANVTSVLAKDGDAPGTPNSQIIYRIESGARDKFRIDAELGVIVVESGANLDRDVFGKEYTLKVLAIDRGTPPRTGSTEVKISITDVNNKSPFFSPASKRIKVSENLPPRTTIDVYPAQDPDETAKLRYKLLQDQTTAETETGIPYTNMTYLKSLFTIEPSNGSISMRGQLDRETVEEVTIKVFVEDINAIGTRLQNATAALVITVLDVNDNPPTFQPKTWYKTSISEASLPGAEVTKVIAVDIDKNPGPIKYYIHSDLSGSFEITDPLTGSIRLKKPLNYEDNQWVNFTVMAIDSGSNPLNSTAWVYVEVEDVNDNSPLFVLFNETVSVLENATVGTTVTRVSATDLDSGLFGTVHYHIIQGAAGRFVIDSATGVISVSGALNRETMATYTLTIEVRDNPKEPLEKQLKDTRLMKINLIDVNDGPPTFKKAAYFALAQENLKVGSPVILVTAEDADDGDNGVIEYSIHATQTNASRMFSVDKDSGQVRVNNSLSGIAGKVYVTLVATDKGRPPLSSTTIIYIDIEDVNDHPPVITFPPTNYTAYIMENCATGTLVVTVRAEDRDTGINGQIRFAFIQNEANKDYLKFSINATHGHIRTKSYIDREEKDTYYVEVVVYDMGKTRFEARRTIKIVAQDEDDNPPTFSRAKYPPPYQVSVLEEKKDIQVANLSIAEDPDVGNYSIICYYLVGGDKPYRERFHLIKETGMLWLKETIDREKVPSVSLIIKASQDCLSNQWLESDVDIKWNSSDPSLLLVRVKILDINDNPPRFLKKHFTAGVTRDTQHKETVIPLADYTLDPDEGNNSVIRYSINGDIKITPEELQKMVDLTDKQPFTVGQLDGLLKTNMYFIGSMQGYFSFEVQITDSVPAFYDRANVTIYLLNQNQRVRIILRGTPEEVGRFRELFSEFLSNITGAIINVDKIQTHNQDNGKPDDTKTDMFIHAVNRANGEILPAKMVLDLIDSNYASLEAFYKRFNVLLVTLAVAQPQASTLEKDLTLALILTAVLLGLAFIIIALTFWTCRRKYKRKLKAATAIAYDSNATGLNRLEMPGTNLHSYEGSNPIWMEEYQNEWDNKDADSHDSLDDNAVDPNPPTKTFDEQEASMELYNDEYDHFNKVPPSLLGQSDIYLSAALKERDLNNKDYNNTHNNLSHDTTTTNHVGNNVANSTLPQSNHAYDNAALEPDEQHLDTRNVNGLQTTEI